MKKNVESNIFLEVQKHYFVFESRLIIFFQMVIFATLFRRCPMLRISTLKKTTLSNVVKFDVEKHNVVSTLFYIVNINVDIHNVVSTLI